MTWLALALGSLAGGFARYFLSGAVHGRWGALFPYGTLAVNLLGCFLIGFFDGLVQQRAFLNPHMRLLLMAGFCGAFTTFSTLMLETSFLMEKGQSTRAFLYVAASLSAGFLLLRLGVFLARLVTLARP